MAVHLPRKISSPSPRDMRRLSGRLASIGPERITAILERQEDGYLDEISDLSDRMMEVDPAIRASFETRTAAIAGARRYVEPGAATGDPRRDKWAEAGAAFFERVLASIPGIEVNTQESLDGIWKGVAAHEIDWHWDGAAFTPERLSWTHSRRFRWWKEDWSLRLCDLGGDLVDMSGVPLEPDGWLVHAPKTIAAYPTRTGVARTVAWFYLFKRWAMQYWVQGAESYAWPFLWAQVPRGATQEVRDDALEGLETMSQERRGLAEGDTTFRLLETTVKDGGTWKELYDTCGREIAKAILGMTDLTDPTKIGAYAAVEVRRGVTVDARIAMDEKALSTTWSQQLGGALMRLNTHLFDGVVPPTPRVRWAVSNQIKAIPPELLKYFDDDEVRASVGADARKPREPGQGAPLSADDVTALTAILASVSSKALAPAAAATTIAKSFPATFTASEARAMVDEQLSMGAAAPALPALPAPAV